jgi:hypothetical protein
MKNLIKVALVATGIFAAAQTQAQTRDTTLGQKIDKSTRAVGKTAKKVGNATAGAAKDVGKATATGAKKVGNKTSELAVKGAAAITDKKYDGKAGPGNENVYIDGNARYYYVNKSGKKVYITQAEMKTKVE